MHRGSSNGASDDELAPETLPLSAPRSIRVELTFASRPGAPRQELDTSPGTTVRSVLRSVGLPPEGCAVLVEGRSVPLDTVLNESIQLTVVRTFSGG